MTPRVDASGVITGLTFVVIGALTLLDQLGVIELRADIVWPAAVIAVGAVVVVRALLRRT